MSRAEPPGSHRAHRHLLTSAADGRLGGPGFQTVAVAETLGPELVEQLEGYVGFFALPEGDPGHPVLQLRRWDDNFQLLTRYLAGGDGGDGRSGNYLAESLLVPTAWLAESGWDVAAAFAALDWWGPEGLAERTADSRSLAEEELPPLAAGGTERLAGLAERAPGELLDHLLLAAVGWAARGERLVVVEDGSQRPEDLEAVISLLPLALPPSCRSTRRAGRWRGIELRTRGPARGMPAVDFAGVSEGDLDDAEAEGGTVIDLGRRLPLEDRPDPEGYDYAQWATAAIRAGRWREIEEVYARAAEVPREELFRRFAELRRGWEEGGGATANARPGAAATASAGPSSASPPPRRRPKSGGPVLPTAAPEGPDLPGDALPGLTAERRERWQGRHSLEAAAARGHDSWRREVEALVAALEDENRRALEELREELDDAGERLLERLRGEREALFAETRRAFASEALEAQKRLHRDLERSLAQVREEGDELLRQIRRDAGQRERKLAAAGSPTRGTASGRAGRARGGGWSAAWRHGDSRTRIAAIAAGVTLVALLAWGGWRAWGPGDDDGASSEPGETGVVSASTPDLLARLEDGPTAGRLLHRARDAQGLAEPAATTALALLLGDVPAPSATERCLLLQAALHRRGLGGPLVVDGDCGPATWRTLAEATTGSCCAELAADDTAGRTSCFLATTFALPDAERCAGADPFATEREWTSTEAANVLALLRAAAETASPSARPAAERLATRLDLAASAEVAERAAGLPVSRTEAGLLLELARALAGDEDVAALLDGLGAPPTRSVDPDAARATAPEGD